MNKLGNTIFKNQPFRLLWLPFPYLRLKLNFIESNSIVTRKLIPLFYVESANQVIVIPQYEYNILVITQVWGEAEDGRNN